MKEQTTERPTLPRRLAALVIWLGCFLFKHDYETYEFRRSRRLVRCQRCNKRWAMSDEHRSFLRYDNDPAFKEDLKRMYPELENLDI